MTPSHLAPRLAFALCIRTIFNAAASAQAPQYTITVLNQVGGEFDDSGVDINASGQVIGSIENSSGQAAVRWTGTTPTILPGLGSSEDFSYGVNASGQVVGASYQPGPNGPLTAVMWNGTTITSLSVPGSTSSQANGINNSGLVVGTATIGAIHAILWNGSIQTDLGVGGAIGINNSGQIAGWSEASGGLAIATVWNGTTPTKLSALPGTGNESFGEAINASGQIAGNSTLSGVIGPQHAVLWNGTTITDLGTLGGSNSSATGINDSGEIVGMSNTSTGSNPGNDPFVYVNGTMYDLYNLLPVGSGLTNLTISGDAINDNGQIVLTGSGRAILLTPMTVPEPSSALLLLGGAALLGLQRRRRA